MRVRLSKKNERGQMAIFVALIFQVLFLFFAMAINIGLVVHDKINLQNAADLAAYYAAQRQAEMLNVIAHTNYQIRQSWKLLNWRYHVLGMMGMEAPPHPSRPNSGASRSDSQKWPPIDPYPIVCVTNQDIWLSAGGDDNACKSRNFEVPNIRVPSVIAGFNPINAIFAARAGYLQSEIANTCTAYAGDNWLFAAMIYASYWHDQRSRRELIKALANNLSRGETKMVDLNGDSLFEGAKKTFEKNLTATNLGSPGPGGQAGYDFQMLNSLAGKSPDVWLPSIDVWFSLQYRDLTGSANNCKTEVLQVDEKPTSAAWSNLLRKYGNEALLNDFLQYSAAARGAPAGSVNRMSIGVEKNPWYMAYVCVKVKSRPRQIFFPFGEPVEFRATACAQPFGGRIGPWYGRRWSREALHSEGDPLQLGPARLQANGWQNSDQPENMVPHYSRYPGDALGLRSLLAQNSLINQRSIRTHIGNYLHITNIGFGKENDLLAYSESPNMNAREYEIAAIAPDLFDITYYSIQPNFDERYLKRLRALRDDLGLSESAFPRGDLGSHDRHSGGQHAGFSVRDQILFSSGRPSPLAAASGAGTPMGRQALDAFWYVREPEHLLTAWVHNDKYGQYEEFPDGRFGLCEETDEKYQYDAPGGCIGRGGRAGYSVKLISPELLRTPLRLGGPQESAAVILNSIKWENDN